MAFPSGWKWWKAVDIDATPASLGGDLSNFPQPVKVTSDSDLALALATGADIRFTTEAAPTVELKFEMPYWSGGGGSAASAFFWVQVPTILAASGANLRMWFGNSGASDGQDTSLWTDVNYEAVWHLDDNGNQLDSTGNGYTLSAPGNAPDYQQTGQNNSCCLFDDANSEYLERDAAPVTAAPMTVTSLAKSDALTYQVACSTADKDGDSDWWALFASGGRAGQPTEWFSYDGVYAYSASTSGYTQNQWFHMAGRESASNSRASFYNGENKGTNATAQTPDNADRVSVGRLGKLTPSNYFSGYLEELRIASDAKSDDWIKYEALSQLTAGNYCTIGSRRLHARPKIGGGLACGRGRIGSLIG